ncbi:Dehydrogenase [Penicillium alfredii]|uniref:Dehydrogenase n=1 Tax=Penicillium alfredii TaxID=1506179 RepID=A0A9W9F807_9EURO|nr:Dehydrogenase [Penicillium alfredii]KAJ5095330.1 Dehydrogenase [Penicillium alfredii]
MGRRITMMWAAAGYVVLLCEKSADNYDGALDFIKANKEQQAARLGTTPGEVKVTASLQDAVQNAWMVIEAIPEKLDLKIELLAQIDQFAPPDCVIASNSSSLRTSQMIVKTEKNYRICNGHYYMPPEQTYYELIAAGFQPAHAKVDSTGLIFNRIWASIKRECLLVMADGVSDGHTIDAMFKSWFQASKGPCMMMDTVGLDTVANIEEVYVQQRGLDPRAMQWLRDTYVSKGNLGSKGGKGLLS